MISRHSVS